MRTVILCLTASSVLLCAAPPSDSFNAQLPAWLRVSGTYQGRVEGFTGGGYRAANEDAYALGQLRLNLTAAPAAWIKFHFQGQDARVWGKNTAPAAPFQNRMDLRQAYVEFGGTENKRWGLRAGRQELVFGEMRLIGHLNWVNAARSFDAVRATYRHGSLRVDAFAASVVPAIDGQFDRGLRNKGDNLHGVYASMIVPKKTTVEPYALWRVSRSGGGRDFKTYGVRMLGKLQANFDYNVEMARQSGTAAGGAMGAWAGHWVAGYSKPNWWAKPRWMAEYNYASGDRDPNDGRMDTFDQLYPTGHDKLGFADQVGWRNIHNVQLGAQLKPHAKWTFTPRYHSFWLASARDALYAANGAAVAHSARGSAGRHVGQEIDLTGSYAMNAQVQIGLGYARLFPGEFLKRTTQGRAYNFPFVMVGYRF